MEIIIRYKKPPIKSSLEKDLEWFCNSLGLVSKRDKNKTSLKLFKLLLNASKKNNYLTIDKMAKLMNLTRTSIVHHLRYMESAGIVTETQYGYEMKVRNLEGLIEDVQFDIEKNLKKIRKIAEELDKKLRLPER